MAAKAGKTREEAVANIKARQNGRSTSSSSGTSTSSSVNAADLASTYLNQANKVNTNLSRTDTAYKADTTAYDNYTSKSNYYTDLATQTAANAHARGELGTNKYQDIYEQAYNNIANREKFSYDQQSDPLYQQYADMYTQNAKLAMVDTMGQASALTGGYGNSYAATAGQAMYNQQMSQLNDKALELYNSALSTYTAESDRLNNQFNAASSMYGTEQSNLQYAADLAESQYQYDMSRAQQYENMAYDYTNLGESAREYDTSLAEEKYQNDYSNALTKYSMYSDLASDYANLSEEQRQYDTSLKYQQDRDKIEDAQWESQLNADMYANGIEKDENGNWIYTGYGNGDVANRVWQSSESSKEREWQSNENEFDRLWESVENQLDRDQDDEQFAQNLTADMYASGIEKDANGNWTYTGNGNGDAANRQWQSEEAQKDRDYESAEAQKDRDATATQNANDLAGTMATYGYEWDEDTQKWVSNGTVNTSSSTKTVSSVDTDDIAKDDKKALKKDNKEWESQIAHLNSLTNDQARSDYIMELGITDDQKIILADLYGV